MSPMTSSLIPLIANAIRFARESGKREHDCLKMQLQASTINHMVDALITRRVEVVAEQCHDILASYAKQQEAYIKEKEKYTDKILDCSDALKRGELLSRVNEIDTRLAELRADALMVFNRMGELILAIGGGGNNVAMNFASDLAEPLGLPKSFT